MAGRLRWKRWRYVMVVSLLSTLLVAVLLVRGQWLGPGWSSVVAGVLLVTTLVGDLVQWRVNGPRLREQGWEW